MKSNQEVIIQIRNQPWQSGEESMMYKVIPEEKVVCVWSEDVPQDEIVRYRQKGYRVAYFIPGNRPLRDALREIILQRC
jgi:hypothetical protein